MIAPPVDDDVTGAELDADARRELLGLVKETALAVSRHLVMASRLIDDDPEAAWQHALAARGRAARIGVVREAMGLTAYRTGRYAEALAELRTARRVTGSSVHLPLMADAERGLGRPERALALATSADAAQLDTSGRVEMLIVAAGARADLGQSDAAVVTLQVAQLRSTEREPWVSRLRSAYADALLAVGRDAEGREWLRLAADVDDTGETGAAERLAEFDGVTLVEFDDGPDAEGGPASVGPDAEGAPGPVGSDEESAPGPAEPDTTGAGASVDDLR